jgi:hypothetical protein
VRGQRRFASKERSRSTSDEHEGEAGRMIRGMPAPASGGSRSGRGLRPGRPFLLRPPASRPPAENARLCVKKVSEPPFPTSGKHKDRRQGKLASQTRRGGPRWPVDRFPPGPQLSALDAAQLLLQRPGGKQEPEQLPDLPQVFGVGHLIQGRHFEGPRHARHEGSTHPLHSAPHSWPRRRWRAKASAAAKAMSRES